jgi:lactoylglutathione lyase
VHNLSLIKKAEHVGIMVKDIERSIAFYRDVLGLELVGRRATASGSPIAFFQVGDVQLELIAGAADMGDGIINHFTFTVTDLDAAISHLQRHQVETISTQPIPVWDGGRVFFFRGPDGEKLEFFERKEQS